MSIAEFDIIDRYFKRSTSDPSIQVPMGDDAAIIEIPPDKQLVVSTDTFIENIHFPKNTSAKNIAHKALAVNLSDLAAMGATPTWVTLALSLHEAKDSWLNDFSQQLFILAKTHGCHLVGGGADLRFTTPQ